MEEHIMQFFEYSHLPPELADISMPFWQQAKRIVDTIPRNPERTVALRKLLEAKDAAVRAKLAKEPGGTNPLNAVAAPPTRDVAAEPAL